MLDKGLINSCLQNEESEKLMQNNIWFYQFVKLLRHECTEKELLELIKVVCKDIKEIQDKLLRYVTLYGDIDLKPKEYFGPGDVKVIGDIGKELFYSMPYDFRIPEKYRKMIEEGKIVFDPEKQPYAAEVDTIHPATKILYEASKGAEMPLSAKMALDRAAREGARALKNPLMFDKSILYCEGAECKHIGGFPFEGPCKECEQNNGYKNYEPEEEKAINYKKCYECYHRQKPLNEEDMKACNGCGKDNENFMPLPF